MHDIEKTRPFCRARLGLGHDRIVGSRYITTSAVQHSSHGGSWIGTELSFGGANFLEVQHVEERVGMQHLENAHGRRGPINKRNAYANGGPATLRIQASQIPHDQRTPIMANEHGFGVGAGEEIYQRDEITGERTYPVLLNGCWFGGPGVAALDRKSVV